jgi:hypothetical protein
MLLAAALLAWAHPYSIACPIDGKPMSFDHQVGYGDKAVCWYSHNSRLLAFFRSHLLSSGLTALSARLVLDTFVTPGMSLQPRL